VTVAFVAGRVLTGKGGAPEKPAPVPERVLAFDALAERFPPRPTPRGWPQTGYDRGQVLELASSPRFGFGLSRLESNRRGLPLLLDWLAGQEGGTWQERWMSSGADGDGEGWAAGLAAWLESRGMLTGDRLRHIAACLMVLVGADVLRPSVSWLLTGGKNRKFALDMVRARDSEGFGKLHLACEQDPGISALAEAHTVFRCTVVVTAKGGKLADITVGDVMELFGTEDRCRTDWHSRHATFKVLRDMGVLGPGVPSLRELRNIGQLSAEELVDRYPVVCRPVRDLLVGYLKERQPSVDYGTLGSLSFALVRCFWADLEAHHPGIDSLRLGPEVASAWKARVRTKKVITRTGHGDAVEVSAERLGYFDVLSTVRAFYLDLAEWAQDDPGRWGPWAAPCPVRRHELSRRKFLRQRKARMDARTRERLPVLPQLLRAAHQWRRDAAVLLAAGREVPPGEQFEAAGEALVRVAMVRGRTSEGNVWAEGPAGSRRRLLNREEEHAFWAWAVIEVLRFTGLRVEELLELSHHSLVKYSLPTTGELVPLLQVAPSKTDAERLLVVSPELADVLSEVIGRVRGEDGAVPLVRAWDYHEHVWLAPSPLLFQHRVRSENREFTVSSINDLINEALARTGLVGADGKPLHCSPHDFRRMFITEAVMNGLPPHIAQAIAGHHNLSTTMGYKAVYPEEALQAHLAFLARRRALRPSEEYRTPTEEEWQAFFGHFERRKVSIGTCGRAFGTPCIHEHACVRCALLWPDPAQHGRLEELRDNLIARISEAKYEGWLGEVEGLEVSLAGAEDKLGQLHRRTDRVDRNVAAGK